MIENVEKGERHDNFKAVQGIGLYKIRYEMDVSNSKREQSYMAGVVAYTSEEAVNTLVKFAKARVKGFKGMKIEEVSFDGLCHAMSDAVTNAVISKAKNEGTIVMKADYDDALKEAKKETKKTGKKQSILNPKE